MTAAQPEIPIVADSLPRAAPDDLARCVFLSITADDPSPGWVLTLAGQSFPFLLLGLQGILYQPDGNQADFRSPDEIDRLVDTIEAPTTPGPLTVETGVIWVPTRWLDVAFLRSPRGQSSAKQPERGDLFRVRLSLFQDLWRLAENRVSLQDLLHQMDDQQLGVDTPNPVLRYSWRETRVFAEWTERQFRKFPGHPGPGPGGLP